MIHRATMSRSFGMLSALMGASEMCVYGPLCSPSVSDCFLPHVYLSILYEGCGGRELIFLYLSLPRLPMIYELFGLTAY